MPFKYIKIYNSLELANGTITDKFCLVSIAPLCIARTSSLYRTRKARLTAVGQLFSKLLILYAICANREDTSWQFPDNNLRIRIAQKIGIEVLQYINSIITTEDNEICKLNTTRRGGKPKRRKTSVHTSGVGTPNTNFARLCLDRPNVHRLSELLHSTLPMLHNITMSSELASEKTHQYWKRGIERTNNHGALQQAMHQIRVNDRQKRLRDNAGRALNEKCFCSKIYTIRLLSACNDAFIMPFNYKSLS